MHIVHPKIFLIFNIIIKKIKNIHFFVLGTGLFAKRPVPNTKRSVPNTKFERSLIMDKDCLFCKIIKGEIPSTKVYEDEFVYGFKDINPAAPIHILVIPKKHIESLAELSDDDEKYVWAIHKAMNKIAEEQGFIENGYRVIVNCGKDSGQEVMHLHYHLLAGAKFGDKIV